MGKNVKLFLIEDRMKDVEDTVAAINEFADFDSETEGIWHFTVEHLPGEGEREDDGNTEYRFYNDKVLNQIQEKIDGRQEGEHIGLLLDPVLTKDELHSGYMGSYPSLVLAPEIYKRFQNKLPIYIITKVGAFYTNSERMMGVDLSDRFVHKDTLLDLKLEAAFEKLQRFFVEWEKNASKHEESCHVG